MNEVYLWLLEEKNPAVRYRTQKELLGVDADKSPVVDWITNKLPDSWYETKGLWYGYYITAFAECGLSKEDIEPCYLDQALNHNFEWGCSNFMLLTSLVKLGFVEHEVIRKVITGWREKSLPDGGFLCVPRLKKFTYTPKSCYKADIHALLFAAECKKAGLDISFAAPLIDYFLKRKLFYKSADEKSLVLGGREGWGTMDAFYPFETQRVGIQNVLEAMAVLGYGQDSRLMEAWKMLEDHKNAEGKVILQGTLTKSYLPKEKVGKASKWATLYTMLAEKYR